MGDKLGNRHVTEIVGLAFDLLNAFVQLNEFKNSKVNFNQIRVYKAFSEGYSLDRIKMTD